MNQRTEGHKQHRRMIFIESSQSYGNTPDCEECHAESSKLIEIDDFDRFRICIECFVNS